MEIATTILCWTDIGTVRAAFQNKAQGLGVRSVKFRETRAIALIVLTFSTLKCMRCLVGCVGLSVIVHCRETLNPKSKGPHPMPSIL